MATSKFLTPAEALILRQRYSNRQDITLCLDGGFDGAERQIAAFSNVEWGQYDQAESLMVFRIEYRKQNQLSHRDILGALMGLGIKREVVGDILCDNPPAYMVCLKEMGGYIEEHLNKAGRVGLKLSPVGVDEIPARTENLKIINDTIASLRLDAVICSAFNVSRSTAEQLITRGLVSMNHIVVEKQTKEVQVGDILSVKGHGRAKLASLGGTSRKGRIYVAIGIYE